MSASLILKLPPADAQLIEQAVVLLVHHDQKSPFYTEDREWIARALLMAGIRAVLRQGTLTFPLRADLSVDPDYWQGR